jgi:ArsR family transcriptional regulator
MNQIPITTPPLHEITRLHAEICSALADPHRIRLLYAIATKPRNVSNLADDIGISQPAASRHLKILRESGLVHSTRMGSSVVYNLTDERLIAVLELLRSILNDRLVYRAGLVEE